MKAFMRNVQMALKSLREIFCLPKNLAIALLVAALVFVFSIWLPNIRLIRDIVLSDNIAVLNKLSFLWFSLGAIRTNYSLFTAALLLAISLLFGMNISLTVYYFKKRIAFQKASGMSIAGMLAGLIGIGCASCGSVVLSAFLGVGATAAVTGPLPHGGEEFSLVSIAILISTLYITAKKAADPLLCKI